MIDRDRFPPLDDRARSRVEGWSNKTESLAAEFAARVLGMLEDAEARATKLTAALVDAGALHLADEQSIRNLEARVADEREALKVSYRARDKAIDRECALLAERRGLAAAMRALPIVRSHLTPVTIAAAAMKEHCARLADGAEAAATPSVAPRESHPSEAACKDGTCPDCRAAVASATRSVVLPVCQVAIANGETHEAPSICGPCYQRQMADEMALEDEIERLGKAMLEAADACAMCRKHHHQDCADEAVCSCARATHFLAAPRETGGEDVDGHVAALAEWVAERVRLAVEQEREACATLVRDEARRSGNDIIFASEVEAAIRARSGSAPGTEKP